MNVLLDRPLFKNLKEKKVDKKIRFQAIKYVLLEEELYYWTIDGVLLKCIDKVEAPTTKVELQSLIGKIIILSGDLYLIYLGKFSRSVCF